MKVAVLGAGGTIAPGDRARPRCVRRGRRDAAARPRRAARRGRGRCEHGLGKVRACGRRRRAASLAERARGLRRARQLGELPGQPRRDGGLPEAGCHYLDLGGLYQMTAEQLELGPRRSSDARPARAARDRLRARQDEPDGRARRSRELGGTADAIHVVAPAGRDLDPPDGLQRSLRAADPDRRADAGAGGAPRRRAASRSSRWPPAAASTSATRSARPRRSTPCTPRCCTFGESFGCTRGQLPRSRCRRRCSSACASWRRRREERDGRGGRAAHRRRRRRRSPSTSSRPPAAGARCASAAVTAPHEDWGLGGGVVSTAAPAAAAVRLLARGEIKRARRHCRRSAASTRTRCSPSSRRAASASSVDDREEARAA